MDEYIITSDYVFIRRFPSSLIPFRLWARCILAFISYRCIVNLSNNISIQMVGLVFWIACTCSGCTCYHLHYCEGVTVHGRCHAQTINEITNGNQGDHVTFVWTWRRSKQRLSFVADFMNLFNTTMPVPYIDVHSEASVSNFLNRCVSMGCQNVRSQSHYVFKLLRMYACLQYIRHI